MLVGSCKLIGSMIVFDFLLMYVGQQIIYVCLIHNVTPSLPRKELETGIIKGGGGVQIE